jgi:F420-non-reducing hydrogenase iron-sulfur subunit
MPGDCHYLEGNANAGRRVEHLKELLAQIGLEPGRVQMVNVSSAMAGHFVAAAAQMSQTIAALGPNPLRSVTHSGKDSVHSDRNVEVDQ